MNEEVVNESVKKTGRPSNARERILESALQLIQERGISSLGVEAIMERAGVGKGSFYHFFKSKEGLLESALEELIRRIEDDLSANVFLPGCDPLEIPIRLLKYLAREKPHQGGLTWLASECIASNEVPEAVRDRISRLFHSLRQRLEACFLKSIAEHELLPHAPVRELAEVCLVILLGTPLLTHCEKEEALPRLLSILPKIWEPYLPGTTSLNTPQPITSLRQNP